MGWSNSSRQQRGYGAAWDRLRKQILERDNYLCQCDQCEGGVKRVTSASEVDHKVSKAKAKQLGWTTDQIDSTDNLRAINSECHKRKTIEDQGKQYKVRRVTGLDGWPI